MPAAYSEDLRWRVVWHKFPLMKSDEEIACELFLSPRTVMRICHKFVMTGSVLAYKDGRPVGTTTLHQHRNIFCWRRLLTSLQHGYISSRQQYKNKLVPSSTFLHCVGHFTDSVLQTRRLVEFSHVIKIKFPFTRITSIQLWCHLLWLSIGKRNCSPKERRSACSIQSWHAKSSASRAHFHWRDRICK